MGEENARRCIEELAAMGPDPFWVMEAITLEQQAAAEPSASRGTLGGRGLTETGSGFDDYPLLFNRYRVATTV
jgi:hypothetical protein